MTANPTADATSGEPGNPPTSSRPTTGFAMNVEARADADAFAHLVAAVSGLGADIRRASSDGDTRRLLIACSGTDHQVAVRATLAGVDGVELIALDDATFALHETGKLRVQPTAPLDGPDDLAMAYTPGVGRVSTAIAEQPSSVWQLTGRANAVAVLSNGTAVLGLGDIGPEAAMPVMEGKAVLFKQFADVDAYPICVDAPTVDEMVAIGAAIAPTFGGINLEDIKAPECFEIERRLQEMLDIPVFHDDQHGTAIVVLAAVMNAAKVIGRSLSDLRVVVVGTGAAGVACSRLLHESGIGDIIGVDSRGVLSADREGLNPTKQWFVDHGNRAGVTGGVREALAGADVLLGLSGPGVIEPEWLGDMADGAVVFALANPVPEIMPELVPSNVAVIATGRSDYPNQINNVLAFPGVFRGLLDVRATKATDGIKVAAASALAAMVPEPTADRIIPGAFDEGVAEVVAFAVARAAEAEGLARDDA